MCDQGQMISLSYKQADPSYTVESGTIVAFPGGAFDKNFKTAKFVKAPASPSEDLNRAAS
jgi:hypothetical protein